MVDLAVQSTTGVKAGFSDTLESQMNKMLHTTAAALKETALSGRSSKDKDVGLSEDAYLDAHAEWRPVVVMDNFLHQHGDRAAIVYEKMASWAATLVQNKVAHVIFLSSDVTCSKLLRLGSLPHQPAETASRIAYLLRRLEAVQRRIEALDSDIEALSRLFNDED